MSLPPRLTLQLRSRALARAAGMAAAALACAGLIGWIVGEPALQALIPGRPTMTPNTGAGLLLIAAALYLLAPVAIGTVRRCAGRVCATIVLAAATLTVMQYTCGVELGIDELLPTILAPPHLPPDATDDPFPLRPPVPSALALMLLSAAALVLDRRQVRGAHVAELLAIAAAIVLHAVLTGHAYDAEILYQEPRAPTTGTALPTALALWALAAATLLIRPDRGIMAIVTSDRVGGEMARRLLAPAIVGPPLLGFVAVVVAHGETVQSLSLSHALLATSSAAVAAGLTIVTAASLNRVDDARVLAHTAERDLRLQIESLSAASTAISDAVARIAGTDLDPLHREIVKQARILTLANHAALALGTDPDRPFERWVCTDPPGPFAALSGRARADVERALASRYAAPRGFLARAIVHEGKVQGQLYLVDKRGADGFSADDVHALACLAERSGTALETARLYREEALAKSWLQGVIDSLPEGVILIDPAGRTSHNKAACCFATAETRDQRGSPRFDLRDPAGVALEWSDSPLIRALRHGEHCNGLELVAHDDRGRQVPVLVSASPLRRGDGQVVGAVCVLQDISTLKQIEQLREQWTAVVAHDLRQPLSVIAMSAQALERSPLPGPTADKAIGRIRAAADRLIRMVRDLLDASRIDAYQLSLERTTFDLEALVTEVAARTSPSTDRVIHVRAPDPLPPLYADPGRIEQVLENLLSNAIKYGDPGTEIAIDLHVVDGELMVSITNHGRGLSPAEIGSLFRRFYRSRASKGAEGLGLGLYIARGLVEAHRGRIWAESTTTTTTFHFTLPLARCDDAHQLL